MSETNGTAPDPQPWDQRPDEPAAAYARFLTYLHLGPARSLAAAYLVSKGQNPYAKPRGSTRSSGQWDQDSRAYRWPERARAWDIVQLAAHGHDAVIGFVHAIEAATRRLLEGLHQLKQGPRTWAEVTQALMVLSAVIPPETIAAVAALREPAMRDRADHAVS